jgi:hypothetical protein
MPIKLRHAKVREQRITLAAVEAYTAGDWMLLHRALGLRPWQPSPLDADTDEPPAWLPPGHAWRKDWSTVRQLRLELEDAAR